MKFEQIQVRKAKNKDLHLIHWEDTTKRIKSIIINESATLREFGDYFSVNVERNRYHKDKNSKDEEVKERASDFRNQVCVTETRTGGEGGSNEEDDYEDDEDDEDDNDEDEDDNENGELVDVCFML